MHADPHPDAGPDRGDLLEHLQVDLVRLAPAAVLLVVGEAEQSRARASGTPRAGSAPRPRRSRRAAAARCSQVAHQLEQVDGFFAEASGWRAKQALSLVGELLEFATRCRLGGPDQYVDVSGHQRHLSGAPRCRPVSLCSPPSRPPRPRQRRRRRRADGRLLRVSPARRGAAPTPPPPPGTATDRVGGAAAGQQGRSRRPRLPALVRGYTLDRAALADRLAAAPGEGSSAAPQTILVPAPNGELVAFAVTESPIMQSGLAAAHPEITTYSGRGIATPPPRSAST